MSNDVVLFCCRSSPWAAMSWNLVVNKGHKWRWIWSEKERKRSAFVCWSELPSLTFALENAADEESGRSVAEDVGHAGDDVLSQSSVVEDHHALSGEIQVEQTVAAVLLGPAHHRGEGRFSGPSGRHQVEQVAEDRQTFRSRRQLPATLLTPPEPRQAGHQGHYDRHCRYQHRLKKKHGFRHFHRTNILTLPTNAKTDGSDSANSSEPDIESDLSWKSTMNRTERCDAPDDFFLQSQLFSGDRM